MGQYVPCPNCGCEESQKMGFTWWGGIIGPAVLTHVKCPKCRTQYNGKTGKSNRNGIIVYSVVVFGIVLALFGILTAMFMVVGLNR